MERTSGDTRGHPAKSPQYANSPRLDYQGSITERAFHPIHLSFTFFDIKYCPQRFIEDIDDDRIEEYTRREDYSFSIFIILFYLFDIIKYIDERFSYFSKNGW